MTQINPFIGSVLQATDVQRQQSDDKDRQLRHQTDLEKNAGLLGDRFEHAVESAQAVDPIHDEQKENPRQKQQHPKKKTDEDDDDNSESHLDLTA
ncbi:MAG TPA: hypothetical protein VHS31_12690 [Tepidisphaeraceae bacterium]|nr:hypothetical protein [Tepidisphaeraceae bacterium]